MACINNYVDAWYFPITRARLWLGAKNVFPYVILSVCSGWPWVCASASQASFTANRCVLDARRANTSNSQIPYFPFWSGLCLSTEGFHHFTKEEWIIKRSKLFRVTSMLTFMDPFFFIFAPERSALTCSQSDRLNCFNGPLAALWFMKNRSSVQWQKHVRD